LNDQVKCIEFTLLNSGIIGCIQALSIQENLFSLRKEKKISNYKMTTQDNTLIIFFENELDITVFYLHCSEIKLPKSKTTMKNLTLFN
jgi:hypothetical protein